MPFKNVIDCFSIANARLLGYGNNSGYAKNNFLSKNIGKITSTRGYIEPELRVCTWNTWKMFNMNFKKRSLTHLLML